MDTELAKYDLARTKQLQLQEQNHNQAFLAPANAGSALSSNDLSAETTMHRGPGTALMHQAATAAANASTTTVSSASHSVSVPSVGATTVMPLSASTNTPNLPSRRRAHSATVGSLALSEAPPQELPMPTILPDHFYNGCFNRNDRVVSQYLHLLTNCRKCGWYSYTGNRRNDPLLEYLAEGSADDWCQACGRIAPDTFIITKNQCGRYVPKPTDIFLGTKVIPFSIKTHDPRNMELFKGMWTKYENRDPKWKFSATEMEGDMFRHRIGEYPTLEMILKSIPVLRKDKVPQDGVRKIGAGHVAPESPFLEDTDAILMERNNQIILQELFQFGSLGFPQHRRRDSVIDGDIQAKWNAKERRGVSADCIGC